MTSEAKSQPLIVYPPMVGDERYKRWSKILTGVDRSKRDGYAFLGKFVAGDRLVEAEPGTIFLSFGRKGSAKYNSPEVYLFKLKEDKSFEELFFKGKLSETWALEVRDKIADILEKELSSAPVPISPLIPPIRPAPTPPSPTIPTPPPIPPTAPVATEVEPRQQQRKKKAIPVAAAPPLRSLDGRKTRDLARQEAREGHRRGKAKGRTSLLRRRP